MIRCIAIDLDDTLLRDDLSISPENKIALNGAIERGAQIILSSGRMAQSMKPYLQKLEIQFPFIAYNGAMIFDPVSDEVIYHRPVPLDIALEIVEYFQSEGLHLNLYQNDQLYMQSLTDWGRQYAASCGVEPHIADDLRKIMTEAPHKLLGIAEIKTVDRVQRILTEKYKGILDFTRSKANYLEILAPGVSKGGALQELANRLGFARHEMMAIGDGLNDLEMVTWAGIGVAIGNAVERLKAAADLVVGDNNHHGVAEAIGNVLL